MLALAFALISGIESYDTSLFSIHMVQHVLLMLVAAPLIALAAPVTLALRVSSPGTRRRWLLPLLHSRVVRFLAHPVVAWVMFAAMMWAAHFSPLFNASLEDPFVHDLEHLLFLSGALLFWWPAVALDPAPWRMSHPARIGYLFTQMTQNTFLAVVILNATTVLYPHYATLVRPWGMTRARGPAPGGGDHVDRRRRDLPDRDPGRRGGLDAGRGTERGARGSPRQCGIGADPDPRAAAGRAPGRGTRGVRAVGAGPWAGEGPCRAPRPGPPVLAGRQTSAGRPVDA